MAPSTARNLEVSITAMQKMFTDVLKELRQAQRPPTKKQSRTMDMEAEINYQLSRRRKAKPQVK